MATSMSVPAMGKTFELGQLWDARNHAHFAGLSLWSSKQIEEHQQFHHCASSEFFYEVSEQERHDNFGLDAEASLSLSLGIVSVEGSAKYLKETQEHTHEVAMSATCKVITRVRRIRQEDLQSIQYARALGFENVTHFVAEVIEGGSATMSFRMEVKDQMEKDNIEGSLSIGIKTWGVAGAGKLELEKLQKTYGKSLNIKFFGDYHLDHGPTTLQAATEEVNSFAEKLKGMTRTLQVVMLPLSVVDSAAVRICRSLAGDAMTDVSTALAKLQSCGLALKELRNEEVMKLFPGIQAQVSSFQSEISKRISIFRDQLCRLLPTAKGLGTDEVDSVIAETVKKAMQWGKITDDFLTYQRDQVHHITELIMKDVVGVHGFENNLARPLPAAPDGVVFLLNLSSIDDVEQEHQLQIDLAKDKKKGKKAAPLHKWWKETSVRDVINLAIKSKGCSDTVDFKAKYLVGMLPSESNSEDDPEAADASLTLHTFHKAKWVSWVAPVIPSSLSPVAESARSIKLTWELSNDADNYIVICAEPITGEASTMETHGASATVVDLQPDTEYKLSVVSTRKHQGACFYDADSDNNVKLRTPKEPSLAVQLVDIIKTDESAGRVVKTKGNIDRVIPTHVCEFNRFAENESRQTVKCVIVAPRLMPDVGFGAMENAVVIITTGETGAGKTTHLNAVYNFLMGVHIDDPFRLVLVDETGANTGVESVTQHVTMYKIRCLPGMPINRSVLLVDSPGFGDTRGIGADAFVTTAFRDVFKELTHLNCIALVVNSTVERLTQKGKMIIEVMLNLFHKQVKDNIVPVCSFADSGTPKCLDGLKADKVPFDRHVKVQNSAFAGRVKDEELSEQIGKQEEDKLHWNLAEAGIRSFLRVAQGLRPQSLSTSSDVLKKRQNLTDELHCLSGALQQCSSKIGEIVASLEQLSRFLGTVPDTKVRIEKPVTEIIDISGQGTYVTNCQVCNKTCHEKCAFSNAEDKQRCCAMDKDGKCQVCPKKCDWTLHHNADHYFKTTTEEEWVVPAELIKKWAGENGSIESAILGSLDCLEKQQGEVITLLARMTELQQDLELNGLRHNPRVLLAYVDSLMESQRAAGASESMLKSLSSAKTALNLCTNATEVKMKESAKANVMTLIKNELRARADLSSDARAEQAKKPSEFYNKCLDMVTKDNHINAKDFPKKLQKNGNIFSGNFPPFSENLKHVGKMLETLLRM